MGVQDHKEAAAALGTFRGAVLTISDSRTEATDESGKILQELIVGAGHQVGAYRLVKNDPETVKATVRELAAQVDFIITTGGTGMSPRDLTIESCRPIFTKELEGFGDVFRLISFQEIGSAAILSRATGGSVGQAIVFCLPGSKAAVRLAAEKLILPEIKHLLAQVRKV
ncbi:MAG TPA: MogA/MoaB family molybdenum cofactor biosynthesis protein [Symbiobacteriaceae bacterium]|jgi:molybdenum cofactor biosynthesis protein B|nr:MogA/MoaB family molybdenum cofactor biosynthesis protein [Symbiobacteriaceae bacterium]